MSLSKGGTEGLKIVANIRLLSTSSAQKKSDMCKGKSIYSDIGIVYPAPEIKNPNLKFKLRWREISPMAPQN